MNHRAKVDLVQDTDVWSRQFYDLVLSLVPAVWDIAVDKVNIGMQPYLGSMTEAVVVGHRAVAVVVVANLDRNLNFDHALADTVTDLWKCLSVAVFYTLATAPIGDCRV